MGTSYIHFFLNTYPPNKIFFNGGDHLKTISCDTRHSLSSTKILIILKHDSIMFI